MVISISLNNSKKFLVDAMLGNVVKKLRLFGFDSKFLLDLKDEKILEILSDEKRILITKDRVLVKKAEKQNLRVIFLEGNEEFEQFLHIREKSGLGDFSINVRNTRCTVCNGELNSVEKETLENIPEKVLQNTEEFWKCTDCGKIYWEGTHIKKLQDFVRRLNDRNE